MVGRPWLSMGFSAKRGEIITINEFLAVAQAIYFKVSLVSAFYLLLIYCTTCDLTVSFLILLAVY